MDSNKRTIILFSFLAIFATIAGLTYAWFSATVLGNEDASNVVIKSGALGILYTDGPEINLNNAMPGDYRTKTFTVENTTNSFTYYSIEWVNIINDFTDKTELIYTLELIDNDNSSLIRTIKEDEIVPDANTTMESNIRLEGNETHTYKLTITFKNLATNQNYNQGKIFSGKINVNGEIEDNYCESNNCNELIHAILGKYNGTDTIKELPTSTFSAVANTEETSGLFKMADDYGTSYYFRGHRDYVNNNVLFAGFQWKIIRILGDGSIRMIYNGTESQYIANGNETNTTETSNDVSVSQLTHIGGSAYNVPANDNTYVGYKYGIAGASTYTATHSDTTNSTIKTAVDNWYENNINNKGTTITGNIVDRIFCNDREIHSGTGYGTNVTYYKAYNRVSTNKTPKLTCTQENDKYTVANGKLTYPIGLITADEVSLAGGVSYPISNFSYYLYTNQPYWTMTPSNFVSYGFAFVFYTGREGEITSNGVSVTDFGIRPLLTLSSTVTILSGDGTSSNPYRIS